LVETRFEGVEYLTVKDYLALGRAPFTDAYGRMTSVDWEIVQKTAADLSIGHLLEKNTDCISDGERQLCAVGRAFVQETPIILLDEPTAFLDYINRNKLLEILVALASKKNKCIILSTHDIDLCLDQAVPLLLASSGKIELFSSLSKDEILKAMY
jgi:iron complex transport system ATP-binding protein